MKIKLALAAAALSLTACNPSDPARGVDPPVSRSSVAAVRVT
ncbi:hypothetical protein [uncultured Brevundimonas sp.]|nr:hypothetical protein [uncultured Brevundimonas sp.]